MCKPRFIKFNGECCEVANNQDYGYGPMIELEDGREYYIFQNREAAGEAAREYWEDMARNEKREFACMVGEDTLISWALGEAAGPGYSKVNSLAEWLDLWLETPEEQWASYDGEEIEDVNWIDPDLAVELGFDIRIWLESSDGAGNAERAQAGHSYALDSVMYRCN